MTNDGLLTTAQVADRCNRTPRTIARWVERGILEPAHKLPGERGAMLFTPREADKAVEAAAAEDAEGVAAS